VHGARGKQGPKGHRESRARKVTKVPFVLQGTKEMLEQWENQDIRIDWLKRK